MIGGVQPDSQQYNRQHFTWLAQETDGYSRRAEAIGAEDAGQIVDLIFDAQVRVNNPGERYVLIRPDQETAFAEEVDRILGTECDQISEKTAYLTTLLKACMAGDLRGNLAEMAEPERNYTIVRKLPPEGTRNREIIKAADWIAAPMHGNGRDIVRECLTRHAVKEPSCTALGRTPADLLDKVHAEIVPDAPRVRGPNPATAYPSSIGGRHLLEQVFKWTSRIIWPGPGEEIWQDVALFYLGAVMTVQGYVDGNKRAARMAYSLTLLKAKLPFVAPNLALESGLARMERPGDA